MATPKWEPGKLYPPGSLVLPRTAPHSLPAVITNPSFETGDLTGWTADSGLSVTHTAAFDGVWALQLNTGFTGAFVAKSDTRIEVRAGTIINFQMMIHQGASNVGNTGGIAQLYFYDAANLEIGHADGNNVNDGRNGAILPSSGRATVPVGCKFVGPGVTLYRNGENFVTNADLYTWDLIDGVDSGLQYKAVQAVAGYSDTDEPIWPINLGVQVVDNEVTWEAVATSRLVWEARAILKSGLVEPVWPEAVGGTVSDGSIAWVATDMRITDPKLPLSKIVTVARYKVFAADGSTVAYCATLNANDWSTAKDAGFIGTSLQENGSNKTTVLNQYNGDLVVMSSSTFQNWQIDPDPQLIDLLTTKNGIGSSWHLAAVPVNEDLFYLSPLGVRTIGVTGASNNLRSGDVGSPIDDLVRAKVRELLDSEEDPENPAAQPLGGYFPSAGQYWLSFRGKTFPALSISGNLGDGFIGESGTYAYVVTGGTGPYFVEIVDGGGNLPSGASMSDSGIVTFDYTTAGEYSWYVRVTDQEGMVAQINDANIIDSSLVSINTEWRYLIVPNTDATDYSQPDYDDSTWLISGQPFGDITYHPEVGVAAHAFDPRFPETVTTFVDQGYIDIWMRCTVTVSEEVTIDATLKIVYDGPASVFLNGVELWNDPVGGPPGPWTVTFPLSGITLNAGDNIIAVKANEWYQGGPPSAGAFYIGALIDIDSGA